MSLHPQSFSGASRLVAAVVSGAAVVLALQRGGVSDSIESNAPVLTAQPRVAAALSPSTTDQGSRQESPKESGKGAGWLLRTGGWYIRVDGAEIELPSFARAEPARKLEEVACPVSNFDELIMRNAKRHGFDWRLVAALIFEESRFKPYSRSSKGAVGLMQVRPIAAEQVGMDRFEEPADNIEAGVKYLRHLDGLFERARGDDRLSLVLAAYNMGPAHVRDAQALAQRYGFDPNRWQLSMDRILPLLEEPQINKDLPAGFAQGTNAVAYVERVLRRFKQYQRDTSDGPAISADALSSSDDRFGSG